MVVLAPMVIGSQRNDASHIEDNDLLAVATHCSTKGPGALVVEVGNVNYFTASTAGNISAMALCAWEGWSLCKSSSTDECCCHG